MPIHFAGNSYKYHSNSLINFLLFYCQDLRENIQKDSGLLKATKLKDYNILPKMVTELQLTISPGLVHRIDRQTSGIVIIAKTIFSMSNLLKQWKWHENIQREYLTLVHGKFDGNELREYFNENNDQEEQFDTDRIYDDIYCADETYSTFYEDEEYEQLYGKYYSELKVKNDKMNWQFGFDDFDFYKCECWIGPKIIGRHLPLTCYAENDYKKQKFLVKDKKINPFRISCSYFYKIKEYNIDGHIFTLLKCKLITGRTHQIRLHLQHLGMGVVGDRIYPRLKNKSYDVIDEVDEDDDGGNVKMNLKRWRPRKHDSNFVESDLQIEKRLFNEGECDGINWYLGNYNALHSHSLIFEHPTTDKTLDFKAEVPPFFQDMLKTLDKHSNS
eukprot:182594_1